MRLVELGTEQLFSEGEPDLEPPEELAVGEIDDDTILEEGLDNEDVLEQDVDDELLSWTLEDLVHLADDLEEPEGVAGVPVPGPRDTDTDTYTDTDTDTDEDDLVEVLEVEDLEDLEESLDLLLALKLAAVGAGTDPGDADDDGDGRPVAGSRPTPGLACGPREFVCRGCFLVHHRAQLADGPALLCRDCTG